jgi:translocation and assembly module TamB
MTRRRKILSVIAASLFGLIAVVFVAGIVIVRTDWFRNMVRDKIVTAVEDATGGKVGISSFHFDWTHLRAQVRDFVIHGLEPANAAPLFRANLVQIDLKLTSPFHGFVDLAYLLVDTPQAHVIVYADGRTNIPAPKIQPKSNGKSGVETIVDLAIGRFDLRNGSILFGDRKTNLGASGAGLRAQLTYSMVKASYSGEIDVSPLHIQSGGNPPLDVDVRLPLTMEKDKITLADAQLRTANSQVLLSGSMSHLIDPRVSAHVNAKVALDEAKRALGLTLPLDTAHGPRFLVADVTGSMDSASVNLQSARASLGASNFEASGTLKDATQQAWMRFRSTLSLGELGALLRLSTRPEGVVKAGGNATMDANNNYKVVGDLDARGVAVHQGTVTIRDVSLDSAVTADNRRIDLSGLRLFALGGSFAGSAGIVDLAQYRLAGSLSNFDIDRVARVFAPKALGYDGVVSGKVTANGSVRDASALLAKASLEIAPAPHGIPVSGHLGVDYNGRSGIVNLDHSHLALPHTTADFSGSLGRQIQIRVVSHNFDDLRPVAAIPVTFAANGATGVDATVSGSLDAPHVAARVAVTNFAVDGRPFTRFAAGVNATQSAANIDDAVLSRGTLQAQFSATVGLHQWKPENYDRLKADLVIRNADLHDVLDVAGQTGIPASGAFHADAHIDGTVGSPAGTADFAVDRGALQGQPFDSIAGRATLNQTAIDVPSLSVIAGPSRIDATAHYQHGVNDLQHGVLTAHVASNQIQLARIQALMKDRPGLDGILNLNADATASIAPSATGTDVQVTALNATAAARNLAMEGKALGNIDATASTAGSALHYAVTSNLAGSTIRVNGESALTGDHQTNLSANIANLPVDRVLALAGQHDIPVKGALSANAQLSGTLKNPQAKGTATIVNGAAYNEPFTRLQTSFNYTDVLVDVPQFHIEDGPSTLDLTASFNHPSGDLQHGQVRFRARSNEIQLSRIHTLAAARPGLAGLVQLTADGAATLRGNAPIAISTLDARLAAHSLTMNRKELGGLTATANASGNTVAFNVKSDFAHSNIEGSGKLDLAAGYPVNAQLTFAGVTWSGLSPLLSATAQPFDASLDGRATFAGPATRPEAMQGNVQLTKLEAHSVAAGAAKAPRVAFEVHNAGNVQVSLANSLVTVQNFHLTGPHADLAITGTASLKAPQPFNLRANGNFKLEALEAFSSDIFSAGTVTLNATATGDPSRPVVHGSLQLQKASFHLMTLPNGLTNTNGTVNFNGTQAVIQNLSGETGGGKVTLAGYLTYSGKEPQFRIQATANHVHIDYPETVTSEANARLTLAGTVSRSLVSGNVTVLNVAIHSHSDVGSILTSAATPPSANAASTGLLGGMRFDVRIRTSTSVQFRTSLTENLQADADLNLRGTPDHPGMIGRLVVHSGDVVFFGAKYSVDQGTISFYNANEINPVLNVDLETTVQGVDVSLSVSGPMSKLKLTYHSDPPLEFQQIVSLLASGKQPTTDPVLAAHQPPPQQQNIQQAGASAVLGTAIANPVSGRLQRLFGVSKLSIDPQIVGETSNNPQATLTLQQQVTQDITFTYTQDVTQTNPSAIRIEWAISPQFSAVAQRDVFGEFALDFFYKKRFH